MPVAILWAEVARSDLLQMYVSIGVDRPLVAERFIDRIEAACRRLADQPRMGAPRPDLGLGIRILVEGPFLVLYEILPDEPVMRPIENVRIIRVVDGRRDLREL